MQVAEHADLRAFNSLRVAARARYLVRLTEAGQIPELLELRQHHALPLLVLGDGSNVLFRSDFDGLVAVVAWRGIEVLEESADTALVRVAAGENWHQLVRQLLSRGLYGLENLSLIPGTTGAAPVQNIGAYGMELCQHFDSLQAVRTDNGDSERFDHERCQFGYRSSIFKNSPRDRYLITSVALELSKHNQPLLTYPGLRQELGDLPVERIDATAVSDAVCRIRTRKLPDPTTLGNAGSFFKNPVVTSAALDGLLDSFPHLPHWQQANGEYKLSAAWMIETCGWRGYRRGDTGVHNQHALVVCNYGSASGADIWALACDIRASVEQAFGIRMEPEPRVI